MAEDKLIDFQDKARIEEAFMRRMETQGVNPKHKKYIELQAEFFLGACCALNIVIPPHWGIAIMSGRDIIEERRKE